MTKQTPEDVIAQSLANEVRGELARQRKTAAELAEALGITQHTMGRRLNGQTPFNVIELSRTAAFLGTTSLSLLSRAEVTAEAVA